VLVEPEEALLDEKENAPKEALLSEIRNLGAGIVLGIFSDARELLRARRSASLRALFGVREAGTEPYLVREIKKTLPLPGFEFPRPRIRRPAEDGTENSGPSGTGGFRATVESKFSGLSGPSLYSELASFRTEGPPVPFVPLRFSGKNPDFERLDKDERDFFLYWRGEFRRGRILKTGEGYIRLYARELCLFTGAGEGVEENFRELVRLLETYREILDSVDSFLPRWIFEFVWIYEKGGPALEPILDCARQSNTPLLTDFYFHRHFIEENNSIEFGDVKALLPDKPFLRDFEIALNGIDHFLRERFRLRLFEFFYPPAAGAETIEAFPGMNGAGKSSYVIEGLRFSKSVPFLSFLEDLYRYTEYRFKIKKGLELKRGAPPLHEVWKELADRALGLEDRAPVPAAGRGLREAGRSRLPGPRGSASLEDLSPSPVPPLPSGELNESALERLRADSDAVRTLLTQDAADPPFPESRPDSGERPAAKPGGAGFLSPAPPAARLPPPPETTLRSFLENLDGAERATLAFIAGVSEKEPKRAGDAMPELVVDRINAAFLEIFGDLLIDTVDERPSIQSEYREEVKKNLGGL
jgi:hypothetical protein